MNSKKIEQAIIFIIDVGRNASVCDDKTEKSFFENAREFTTRLIERQIISQSKNWVGVMLLGSKKTNNNMEEQCEGAFKHIDMISVLTAPTWKMIKDIPEKPSNSRGDWIDALIVAAEHYKSQSGVKILHKKIILMTNFLTPTNNNSKNIDVILEGFKNDNYEVDIIGPDLYDDNFKGDDVELARKFVETTEGQTANFDFAMEYLSFHRKRAVNAVPWNVDLSIGPNLKIPVSSYVRLKDEPVVKKWMKGVRDPVTDRTSTTEGIKWRVPENTDSQQPVDKIQGFHYGQKAIPISDWDKSMLYESGDKCLSVYGFTDYDNIKWQSLNSDGLSYVFGRKGDKKAQHAIRCLVECLHSMKLVGLVRRVYSKNNAPKMYALFPVIDTNNYVCLSMAAVCFKDDIKYMSFPSTKKFSCTNEQVNAFKDLITAMDLTKAYDETYDDTEAFPVARTVSPYAQYVLDCIAFRAMNPGKPLPKPREEIMNLFQSPPQILCNAKKPLEILKGLFVLNKVEKKHRKKKLNIVDHASDTSIDTTNKDGAIDNIPKIQLPIKIAHEEVTQITTLNPVSDYTKLKNKGKTLSDLAADMTSAIEDLVYCNMDKNYTKPFTVMTFFRTECINDDPSVYNNWLQKFKLSLKDRRKSDVIDLISERNVSFILKSENSLSTYETNDSQDNTQLYENDTVLDTAELTIQSEVNDLFDEF